MKAFLTIVLLSVSINTFAQSIQSQKSSTDLWDVSKDVMYKLGADPRLNPQVIYVNVDQTISSRVKIKFQYREDMYGKKTCTYWFDTLTDKVRPNSWFCEV